MAFVRAGDLAVHCDIAGNPAAPVLLFANSLGTNFHVWDGPFAHLSDRYRIVRYDMRGHGLTDCPAKTGGEATYTIDQLAGDVVALLDALDIRTANFCGMSIGGMVGQKLAVVAPDRVDRLILCATASRIGPPTIWDERIDAVRENGLAGIADAVLARWFTDDFRAGRPVETQGYANMLIRTPSAGYIGCCGAVRDADLTQEGAHIACPTLVVCGEQDLSTPPEAARGLADSIPGARFALIEDAAHIVSAEQPTALSSLIAEFLGEADND